MAKGKELVSEFIEDLDREHGLDEEELAAAQQNSWESSAVKEFLEREGHVPGHEAHVVSKSGQVDLSGEVSWLMRMAEAERALLKMSGVSGVTNHLSVRPFESEADLKSRVVDALVTRAHSVANRITVGRRNGILTLSGTLSSPLYREVASQVAKSVAWESNVDDRLTEEFSTT